MDGFENNSKIIVVATSNRYQDLDPALIRAGRFDRKVNVDLPNDADRASIMKIHLRSKNHYLTD
jgi:cell division protease FtsH